jgi:hypothetical protein
MPFYITNKISNQNKWKRKTKTIFDSVNHSRFPKKYHLRDSTRRDNQFKKCDRVEYSYCFLVDFGIQHAKRMHSIIFSFVNCLHLPSYVAMLSKIDTTKVPHEFLYILCKKYFLFWEELTGYYDNFIYTFYKITVMLVRFQRNLNFLHRF